MSGLLLWEEVMLDSAITVSVIGVPGLCVLFVCLFVAHFYIIKLGSSCGDYS